jgi:hypothetical protein
VNIDQYIKKATAGLPTRERIDTAAELRVHLNAQVKKHLLEGHSREEAEFLAVDAMGAPAPVNRQLIGHMFTPQLGWRLVVAALAAIGLWFGVQKLLEPRAGIYRVETTVDDLMSSIGIQSYTYNLVPPAAAKSFRTFVSSPTIPQHSVYGQTIDNRHFRYNIQLHNNYQCPPDKQGAISITEKAIIAKDFQWNSTAGGFSLQVGESGYSMSSQKPHCVLPASKYKYGVSYGAINQPNAYEVDRWYPIFQMRNSEPNMESRFTYTHYIIFSSKDQSQPISPPRLSDSSGFFPNQSIPAGRESNWEHAKIPIPQGSNSVLIVGSSQKSRYSGYAIDLNTRNNIKLFDIRLDHSYYGGNKGCLGTSWRIQFGFNPGERNMDLCENLLQTIPKEFSKDNLVFGEFVNNLSSAMSYKLDTWVPVYVVPNYVSGRTQNPKPQQNTDDWYVLQVKFSSKRVEEGSLPFPKDLPQYQLRHPQDYYSLEAVK